MSDINDPRFQRAVRFVLDHEGGFVNHHSDPGGATNYGVSLRFLQQLGDADGDGWLDGDLDRDGDVDVDDIRHMSEADAILIYHDQWWARYRYDRFHDPIACKLFDLSVNMGAGQAHRLLQRSVRAVSGKQLVDDGIIGRRTMDAVHLCEPNDIRIAMRSEAAGFYRSLVARKPRFEVFLNGWLNRAYA